MNKKDVYWGVGWDNGDMVELDTVTTKTEKEAIELAKSVAEDSDEYTYVFKITPAYEVSPPQEIPPTVTKLK